MKKQRKRSGKNGSGLGLTGDNEGDGDWCNKHIMLAYIQKTIVAYRRADGPLAADLSDIEAMVSSCQRAVSIIAIELA